MFFKLVWKEWKENLWKLMFCSVVSLAFIALLFRMRIIPDAGVCVLISMIQLFVIPVVYCLDIFSGEMSNRTIHLLFKLPVERWKIFMSKYLVSIAGIAIVFILSSLLMEFMAHGREMGQGYLIKYNLFYGLAALLLFTWFCPFGCQSRSEAGSLAAMTGVAIGFGIVYMWAVTCKVIWVIGFVPYIFTSDLMFDWYNIIDLGILKIVVCQLLAVAVALTVACYRYVKIRRYL